MDILEAPSPAYFLNEYDLMSAPLGGTGTATTLGREDEDDVIRRLHEAVKDVTGRPAREPVAPNRMGFI